MRPRYVLSSAALLLGFLLALPSLAQSSKTITSIVKMAPDGEVVIDNHKGSIRVTTWDRAEVSVEAEVVAEDERADELVEATEIVIREGRNRVSIETDYDETEGMRRSLNSLFQNGTNLPAVHYTVRIPRTANLVIDDHKSDIRVADLDGDLRLDTHKGEVELTNLGGGLWLDTHKGNVHASFTRLAGPIAIDTHKGDVTLRLPPGAGFDLAADIGARGRLDADFGLRSLRRDEDRYAGAVYGGGPRLAIDTHKGDVTLHTK